MAVRNQNYVRGKKPTGRVVAGWSDDELKGDPLLPTKASLEDCKDKFVALLARGYYRADAEAGCGRTSAWITQEQVDDPDFNERVKRAMKDGHRFRNGFQQPMTEEEIDLFLEVLASRGLGTEAADAVGRSTGYIDGLRKRDPEFRRRYDEAKASGMAIRDEREHRLNDDMISNLRAIAENPEHPRCVEAAAELLRHADRLAAASAKKTVEVKLVNPHETIPESERSAMQERLLRAQASIAAREQAAIAVVEAVTDDED